jgi:hypothetical protein
VDAQYAIVFVVRANLIARAREYATLADALAAVGLSEQAIRARTGPGPGPRSSSI